MIWITPAVMLADRAGWLNDLLGRPDYAEQLRRAALAGQSAKVRTLLARGVDPNAISDLGGGVTPLAAAIRAKSDEVFDQLLAAGAMPDLPGQSSSPLMFSIWTQNVYACSELLDRDATIGRDRDGRRPLVEAVRNCGSDRAILDLLLAAGADPYARDRSGASAVSEALEDGNEELAAYLQSRASDFTAPATSACCP